MSPVIARLMAPAAIAMLLTAGEIRGQIDVPVPAGTEQLTLLGQADPCQCKGSPFPWSYSSVWGFAAAGREYAALGSFTGTYVIDVTTPQNPVVASFVNGPDSNWRELKKIGNYLLATNEASGGLQVIDISNPYAAFQAAAVNQYFNTAHTLYVDEPAQRAYIFGASGPIPGNNSPILDVSNPVSPVLLGNYRDFYLHDGYERNGVLHGARIYEGGMPILNVANPAAIQTLRIVTWPDAFTHNTWLTEDGSYCLTTDENNGGHVRIWDVRDLDNIAQVSEYNLGANVIVHNVYVRGDHAYVAYYTEGVRVVDLSDIENPTELGYYDTSPGQPPGGYGGCWGVYAFLPSGNILASDVERGLYVFAPVVGTTSVVLDEVGSLPARPFVRAIYPNPFHPATTIALTVPDGVRAVVHAAIYDPRGRLVRPLTGGLLGPGDHHLRWDGRDGAGRPVASGSYFLRLEAGADIETHSLLLVR